VAQKAVISEEKQKTENLVAQKAAILKFNKI
jgi:hypothetical protein